MLITIQSSGSKELIALKAIANAGVSLFFNGITEITNHKHRCVDVTGDLTLTDTDAGSAAGPELKLYRDSASPADADYLDVRLSLLELKVILVLERNYAKITGKILDASNGTEDGILEFAHITAGSQTIYWKYSEVIVLQLSNDGTN